MSISINWTTKVINVPQEDLTLVSGSLYELDVNNFRLELKNLEATEGIPYQDTHRHSTEVSLGDVVISRVLEIINGYTITFEDGQYAVKLVGANNNISDVTNINQVSLRAQNSAGLQTVTTGSGLSEVEKAKLDELHKIHGLASGVPLTVSDTDRVAGTITQSITGTDPVTVTRTDT